jgi:predicted acetyltransferase
MREYVAEMRVEGFAVSTLYPATQPVYRKAGYERAGAEYRVAVEAKAMAGGDLKARLRPSSAADEPAIEECYRRRARLSNGNLDRSRFTWDRILRPLTESTSSWVVDGEAGIEGHVCYVVREIPSGSGASYKLWCPDVVALTPRAARRMVSFFADHRSTTGEIAWRGSPADPVLAVLREQHDVLVRIWDVWMLRILDVAWALSSRGYPPVVAGEVHLDIARDEAVPENVGRFVLRVADGRGQVERGGHGTLRTDIRGLAAMYTGFHSAADLRAGGFVEADDAALVAASAVFAGPQPWMADHF